MATIIIKGADFSAQALPLADKDVFDWDNFVDNFIWRKSATANQDGSYQLTYSSDNSRSMLQPIDLTKYRAYNFLKVIKGNKKFIVYAGDDLTHGFPLKSNGEVATTVAFVDGMSCSMDALEDYDNLYINIDGHLTDDMQIIFSMEEIV